MCSDLLIQPIMTMRQFVFDVAFIVPSLCTCYLSMNMYHVTNLTNGGCGAAAYVMFKADVTESIQIN